MRCCYGPIDGAHPAAGSRCCATDAKYIVRRQLQSHGYRPMFRFIIVVVAVSLLLLTGLHLGSMMATISWTSPSGKHTFSLARGAFLHRNLLWMADGFPPPTSPLAQPRPPGWQISDPPSKGNLVPGIRARTSGVSVAVYPFWVVILGAACAVVGVRVLVYSLLGRRERK